MGCTDEAVDHMLPLSQAQDSPHSYSLCILYTFFFNGVYFSQVPIRATVLILMAYLFNGSHHLLSGIREYDNNQPWEQKNKCLPNL